MTTTPPGQVFATETTVNSLLSVSRTTTQDVGTLSVNSSVVSTKGISTSTVISDISTVLGLQNGTYSTSDEASVGAGVIVGVVLAGLIALVLVGLATGFLLKRRSYRRRVEHAWHSSLKEQMDKRERASWHAGPAQEPDIESVSDVEMQPTHMFPSHTNESLKMQDRKETVCIDKGKYIIKSLDENKPSEDDDNSDIEHVGPAGKQYTLVRKPRSAKESEKKLVHVSTDLALDIRKHAESPESVSNVVSPNPEGDNGFYAVRDVTRDLEYEIPDNETGPHETCRDDEEYVEMRHGDENNDSEDDSIYTNVTIKRANTLNTTKENKEHASNISPRRAASEMSKVKAPIPQPRRSVKRPDPYDYPPKRDYSIDVTDLVDPGEHGETSAESHGVPTDYYELQQYDEDEINENHEDYADVADEIEEPGLYTYPDGEGGSINMSIEEYEHENVYEDT
ncbi:uncharacterized protein LOC128215094 [Mya arenaria]|uniref:uncharacterized protein LOC128215094 n=1 Tax=Mya arenaria TaxID=6604 RepID=UPI0022E91D85|nr:uncharacterized protein LOC128215094 [Mya arenaria]